MKRTLIFDTETTGINPYPDGIETSKEDQHYIVEIGAVELIDNKKTGNNFHVYIKPPRSIPEEVVKIHGIDDAKVENCFSFKFIAEEFLNYIGQDSILVAHNAGFDMSFLNAELARNKFPLIDNSRVIDTLEIAKKKHLGKRVNLDALCDIYEINRSGRKFHGALLDSELLADVYIELIDEKQKGFNIFNAEEQKSSSKIEYKKREHRTYNLSENDLTKHENFINNIKGNLWESYKK